MRARRRQAQEPASVSAPIPTPNPAPAPAPADELDTRAQLDALTARTEQLEGAIGELRRLLEVVHDDERGHRRRLAAIRDAADYAGAYDDPDPLVSIVIATYDNADDLRARAIPSALAQTHANIEVLVVGDGSPPNVEQAALASGDPRVHWHRLPVRGPYPDGPFDAWLASGTPPFNAALRLARGRWIAPLADDDAFTPDHVAVLLQRARAERLELCYGKVLTIMKDGRRWEAGEFPPRLTQFALQASIIHAGLRSFELSMSDAAFGTPNDWGWCRRAMLAGVRMGMVDRVVAEIYPGPSWRPREGLSPTAIDAGGELREPL